MAERGNTGMADSARAEARAMGELAALQVAPVFWGRGVPRGDRRLVVVLPGLFGTDLYLRPMRQWLRRIGYTSLRSSLSINAGCPNRVATTVAATIDAASERTPGPIAIVGHSRGGMLGWALASRLGDRVSHLALLGSPAPAMVAAFGAATPIIPSSMARRQVADAGARAVKMLDPDCTVPECGCPYVTDIRTPLASTTKVLSIFTRDDPIVRPAACRIDTGENVEIGGSHSGLAFNRAAYGPLARFLAER